MAMAMQGERPLITSRLVRHRLRAVPLIKFFSSRQTKLFAVASHLPLHILLRVLKILNVAPRTCIE